METSTISMVIFHSYVKLPEGSFNNSRILHVFSDSYVPSVLLNDKSECYMCGGEQNDSYINGLPCWEPY